MRLLFDQNLSWRLREALQDLYPQPGRLRRFFASIATLCSRSMRTNKKSSSPWFDCCCRVQSPTLSFLADETVLRACCRYPPQSQPSLPEGEDAENPLPRGDQGGSPSRFLGVRPSWPLFFPLRAGSPHSQGGKSPHSWRRALFLGERPSWPLAGFQPALLAPWRRGVKTVRNYRPDETRPHGPPRQRGAQRQGGVVSPRTARPRGRAGLQG